MKFCDWCGTGLRAASGCKEGTEVGKKSNKTIQTWTIAFGVVLSLHTKVSKPATLSLGYRDKSVPGFCVPPFGRNPPLPPSCGKHLHLWLKRPIQAGFLPGDPGCHPWEHLGEQCLPHRPAASSRVCSSSQHCPAEQLPSFSSPGPGEAAALGCQLLSSALLNTHGLSWERPALSQPV